MNTVDMNYKQVIALNKFVKDLKGQGFDEVSVAVTCTDPSSSIKVIGFFFDSIIRKMNTIIVWITPEGQQESLSKGKVK